MTPVFQLPNIFRKGLNLQSAGLFGNINKKAKIG